MPRTSVADVGYFTSSLFFLCGLWYCHNRTPSSEVSFVQIGNLGIIFSATLLAHVFLYYELLRVTIPLSVAVTAVAYGVLDVTVALAAFVVVYLHIWGQKRFVMLLVLLGFSGIVVSDFTYAYSLSSTQSFSSSSLPNGLYLLSAGFLFWAAFEQDRLAADGVGDEFEAEFEDRAKQWETLFSPLAVASVLATALLFRDELTAEMFPYSVGVLCLFVASLGVRGWWGHRVETQLREQTLASEAALRNANRQLYEEMETRASAEEELRQSQKMEALGHLTGGVAHDFNNLLAVILSNLEMAQEKAPDQSDLHEYMRDAIDAALRGASLTQRLLGLSRKQALRPETIDVGALLEGMTNLLERTLGERIQVRVEASAALWPCVADRAQLENTMLNLAINSRDAMIHGGELAIQARNIAVSEGGAEHPEIQTGSYVVISVRDTGIGISDEIRSKVFDPFFTTKEIGAGTGLGLSMVYGFAKQSGGHVAIDSEVGRGTEVRLYLPRSETPAREVESEESGSVPRGNGEAVLVVEDEPAVRKLVLMFLEDLGYSAVAVGDGEEALASLDAIGALDLLLSDVVLPGQLTGRALVEAVQSRRPGVKVLLMSGYAPKTLLDGDPLEHGGLLLNKPFRKIELARKIRSVLDSD
jgi:signal transduction histidine kinase/CheY-like chemotaxis protein